LPDGGTCECYWIEVDTGKSVAASLPWEERVNQAAAVAFADFARLASEADFIVEGRRAFAEQFRRLEAQGHDPAQSMCFVWYLVDGNDASPVARPS
jgi:hypothetical protein